MQPMQGASQRMQVQAGAARAGPGWGGMPGPQKNARAQRHGRCACGGVAIDRIASPWTSKKCKKGGLWWRRGCSAPPPQPRRTSGMREPEQTGCEKKGGGAADGAGGFSSFKIERCTGVGRCSKRQWSGDGPESFGKKESRAGRAVRGPEHARVAVPAASEKKRPRAPRPTERGRAASRRGAGPWREIPCACGRSVIQTAAELGMHPNMCVCA